MTKFWCAPVFLLAITAALQAQSPVSSLDFSANSEMENYLRVMQIAGKVPLYPWSIRGFSRREVARLAGADSTGPWRLAGRLGKAPLAAGPLRAGLIFNSAFPYGANDGPVWAGRGLTAVASGGMTLAMAGVTATIDPIAFSASNRPFTLLPNGLTGPQIFNRGGPFSDRVDLPQRFGDRAYSRLDPGNSSIRLDSRFITLGISTANEWMGPATEYAFLLSNNAPGFPHVFIGTGEPMNIGIGRLHARLMWGRLYQSDYSPVTGPAEFAFDTSAGRIISGGTTRLTATGEMVFVPRWLPGLELGVARFFHVPNTPGGANRSFWMKPFRVVFLKNEQAQGDIGGFDNQLASLFFRWAFPTAGLEVYGERGFEDQLYDLRDLILNLDHEREYMLGFQKTLRVSPGRVDVLSAELINYQEPGIARDRGEGGIYVHTTLKQGHTNRGQLLGAAVAAGWGAASKLAWTRYSGGARTTATLRRIVRDQNGDFPNTDIYNPRSSDVILALGLDRTRFGRWLDLGAGLDVMRDFNRNFTSDVSNLNLRITTRLHR